VPDLPHVLELLALGAVHGQSVVLTLRRQEISLAWIHRRIANSMASPQASGPYEAGWRFTQWVQCPNGEKTSLTSINASHHMCASVDPGLELTAGLA
jgi:hypothetical protein